MTRPVKPDGVSYPRRSERARLTRRRVIGAARDLFLERGYVASSIASIAGRADVSPETIYSVFGTKRALLSEVVDLAISGEAEPVAILDQAWVQALRKEPDARRRLRILAQAGSAILQRRAAVDEVVRGAATADPAIAALQRRGQEQRLAGQRELLRIVFRDGGLRDGLQLDAAADILYAVGSPQTYRLLVVDRGWTAERFERWYRDTLERLLLDSG